MSEHWYALLGGALIAIGASLLLWALFGDRSRGRARCSKCWYRLEGVPADERGLRTCPECGRAKLSARDLARTRRRKRWAGVALVLLVSGWGVWKFPQARARGLWSYAPTTVLILVRDLAFTYRWGASDIGAELLQRVYDGKVSSWQLAKIDPPGLRAMLSFPLGDDMLWPAGVPVLAGVDPPGWMFRNFEFGEPTRCLELTSAAGRPGLQMRVDHGSEVVLSRFVTLSTEGGAMIWERSAGFWTSTHVLEGDQLNVGATVASFDWTLRTFDSDRIIWTGRRELPISIVPINSPALALEPRRSAALDGIVRRGLITGIDPGAEFFSFIIGPCHDPDLSEIALSIRAEILLDGRAVASLRFAVPPGGLSEIGPSAPDAAWPRGLSVSPKLPTADLLAKADRATLRVRPDVGALVYHGLSGPYWDGDLTIPLSEILAR